MKKIDVGQAVNTLANIGVIVGIVFLVIEINQNTRMMETQSYQARTEMAMSGAAAIYNSEFLPEIMFALEQGQPLDGPQQVRFRHWLRSFHRLQDNLYRQYRDSLLDEEILRSIENAIRDEVAPYSFARQHWTNARVAYSEDYRALVDHILDEESSTRGN